jgi:mono/diheme cytochrome c family protein
MAVAQPESKVPEKRDVIKSWGDMMRALIVLLFLAVTSAGAQTLAEMGKVIVEGIAACGNCHSPRDASGALTGTDILSGGVKMPLPGATVFSSNLTPDETGIGRLSDEQVARAVRGIRGDGTFVGPPHPAYWYQGIVEQDMQAIVAYLRSLPPVKRQVPPPQYAAQASAPAPLAATYSADKADQVGYGRYLVEPVGHCMNCHAGKVLHRVTEEDLEKRLGSGGKAFGPGIVARNITPHETGLKDWSDADIEKAIRDGVRPDGTKLKPPMPYAFYKNIPEEDMKAIITYLRALKPVPFGG